MKKLLGAAALAAATVFAGAALANDTLDATFGNTVTVTNSEGAVVSYYMNEDGTYSMTAGEDTINGTWTEADGQVCLTPEGGEEACSPVVDGKSVGDTWEGEGSDGSTLTFAIVEGR
jgi:hypothetical protein